MPHLIIERRAAGYHVAHFDGLPVWRGDWAISRGLYGGWYVRGHGTTSRGHHCRTLGEAKGWLRANAHRLAPTSPQPPTNDGLPF